MARVLTICGLLIAISLHGQVLPFTVADQTWQGTNAVASGGGGGNTLPPGVARTSTNFVANLTTSTFTTNLPALTGQNVGDVIDIAEGGTVTISGVTVGGSSATFVTNAPWGATIPISRYIFASGNNPGARTLVVTFSGAVNSEFIMGVSTLTNMNQTIASAFGQSVTNYSGANNPSFTGTVTTTTKDLALAFTQSNGSGSPTAWTVSAGTQAYAVGDESSTTDEGVCASIAGGASSATITIAWTSNVGTAGMLTTPIHSP